ncbi:DUF6519 domain-containing protein [Sorangium sp. So ce1335]|uniref:DUF6519 domain-containing protein n=1 Tax=Sorangium sp. So ce1335 TaxID=3133335 RepID=UPI003F625CC7
MKGDFTRGHRPDAKRKEKYRRVLLQEGRLVLDSDVAAGADAVDTLLRDLASDVGCESGSPDLGYLATPGPLLAVFEALDGVTFPGGGLSAYRDYGVKYEERFPSVRIGAQSAAGFVHIVARRKLDKARYPRIRLWIRANADVEVRIHGIPAAQPIQASDASAFQPYDVDVPGAAPQEYHEIEIGFSAAGASNQAWIGLIEGLEPAGEAPRFSYTRGRYYLRGVAVESAEDGIFWDSTFPAAKGFASADVKPPSGSYVVAYLEGWERLVTHIEDRGILEQALGGALDTTVRSKAVGQVKLALFASDGSDPLAGEDDVPAAFEAVDAGTGRLKLTTKVTPDNLDPCAIPEAGGYTGADNRFYRFEVHRGGAPGVVEIKWSKNNGSDAFAVASVANTLASLTLAAGADVKDGDLIELIDETDDLGDDVLARVALATRSFRPAERSVGELFYAETTTTAGQIKLRDVATKLPVNVPNDFASKDKAPRKVRVWHGLLRTAPQVVGDPPVTAFSLGDGITVELSGTDFRPGDYWQHEARKIKDNDNGPWREEPHGPERLFAPLALFRYDGAAVPLVLIRWYDHQYSAICELNADDIAYDGGKVGTDADTVQEAIDELYSREDGGCCDVSLSPSKSEEDDTARLQKAIDDVVAGGTICLERGVYRIHGRLNIIGKRVTIAGCPHATILGHGVDNPVFHLSGSALLSLRDLLVFGRQSSAPLVQIEVTDHGVFDEEGGGVVTSGLRIERAGLVHPGDDGIAVRVDEPALPSIAPQDATPLSTYPASHGDVAVEADDAVLVGAYGIVAEHLRACKITDSVLVFDKIGIYAKGARELQMHRATLQGWLQEYYRAGLMSATDEDLERMVVHLVETGAGSYPRDGSAGVVVGQLYSGSDSRFEGCSISAATAVFVGDGSLTSASNEYQATNGPAIRFDRFSTCRFSGDRIHSGGAPGLWAPWYTYRLEVEGCTFQGSVAIVFTAAADGGPLPALESMYPAVHDVCIHHNHCRTYTAGIQLGPAIRDEAESSPPVITLERVDIASNNISDAPLGVGCTLVNPPPWDEEAARPLRLRVAENCIDAGVGVLALGDDVIVKDNTIHATYPLWGRDDMLGLPLLKASRIGIYLADGGRSVVQGNTIHLEATTLPEEGGSIGILLYERWAEGNRNNIVIDHNAVTASAPLWVPKGETGAGTYRLVVGGNRFAGLGSKIDNLFGGTLRRNTFVGGLRIDLGDDSVVSDNDVQSNSRGSSAGIEISNARGGWQIEGNRAQGSIVLQPTSFPYAAEGDRYAAFIQYLLFWSNPANGGGTDAISVEEARRLFRSYLERIGLGSVDMEWEYAAQVEGNWTAADLVVGHPFEPVTTKSGAYSPALPDVDSTIQIVANRADGALITNRYGRLVLAHNFAREYSISGWSQVGPITAPNFDAP